MLAIKLLDVLLRELLVEEGLSAFKSRSRHLVEFNFGLGEESNGEVALVKADRFDCLCDG